MRLTIAIVVSCLGALTCAAGIAASAEGPAKFQICKSDNPKKCDGEMFVPCNLEAGSLAQYSCQKKGWKFFTLAKVKEMPGGQCGSTIYNVKCE